MKTIHKLFTIFQLRLRKNHLETLISDSKGRIEHHKSLIEFSEKELREVERNIRTFELESVTV